MKADQTKVSALILDTITSLCKNGLAFSDRLRIQGLIGITTDDNEVFIIQLDEFVSTSFPKPCNDNSSSNILTFQQSNAIISVDEAVAASVPDEHAFKSKSKRKSVGKKRKCSRESESSENKSTDQPEAETTLLPAEARNDCMFKEKQFERTNNSFLISSCPELEVEPMQPQHVQVQKPAPNGQAGQKNSTDVKNEGAPNWYDCSMNVGCNTKWIDDLLRAEKHRDEAHNFESDVQSFNNFHSNTFSYLNSLSTANKDNLKTNVNLTTSFHFSQQHQQLQQQQQQIQLAHQQTCSTTTSNIATNDTLSVQSSGFPMYRCPYEECGFTFLYKRSSHRHQRTKHGSIFGVTNQATYVCPHDECGKVFYKPNSFARHQNCSHLKKCCTGRNKVQR